MYDLNGKHMKYGFMKNGMSRDKDRMSMKTIKLVSFHAIRVANEYGRSSPRIKLCSISR